MPTSFHTRPQWQPHFSERATSCLRGLLMKPPTRRLGSGPDQDKEIMQHPFFEPVDFEKLAAKKVVPPFRPDVKNILDPKFVPKTYLQVRTQHSARKSTLGFASRATFIRVRILQFYRSANYKNGKKHHHHHHHILLLDCSS